MAEILNVISDPNLQLKQNEPKPPNNQEIPRPPENNDPPTTGGSAELFQEFCSGVTLHGFRFLFEGNPIRRLVWFLITTTVFSFCFFMFYDLFSDFLLRKTTTANNKRIQEKDIPFPTVTICPINAQSKTKLNNLPFNASYTKKEFLELGNFFSSLTEDRKGFYEYLEKARIKTFTEFLQLHQLTYKDISDTDVLKKSSAFYRTECSFYDDISPCDKKGFVDDKIWDGMDKNTPTLCMQFNHYDPELKPFFIGKAKSYFDGFNIYFDLGETFYHGSAFMRGMVVRIDPYGYDNSLMSSSELIFLKTGEMTILKMTEHEIIRLPAPFDTKCASVELPMIDPSRRYTKGLCVMNCVLKRLYEECGCIGEHYKRLVNHTGVKICSLRETMCFMSRKHELLVFHKTYILQCYDSCPNECHHQSYTVKKTSSSLGTEEIYDHVLQWNPKFINKTLDDVEKYYQRHVVGLHVSFVDNVVKTETAHPVVTSISLIANVGGAVGLGLGFSFITCFEFVFFFYDFIKLKIQQRRNKKIKTVPTWAHA